jgi:hypothetical protein
MGEAKRRQHGYFCAPVWSLQCKSIWEHIVDASANAQCKAQVLKSWSIFADAKTASAKTAMPLRGSRSRARSLRDWPPRRPPLRATTCRTPKATPAKRYALRKPDAKCFALG